MNASSIPAHLEDKLGVCQWFHYLAFEDVERTVDRLRDLGVRHLRTGISWADFHRERGREWYRWQMRALRDFDVLVSIWHTPPSIAEAPSCAAPPRRLEAFAEFVWEAIDLYGDDFADLELWNEPNNRYKWNFEEYDPHWAKLGRMIALGAATARSMGKRTVLGGMIPVDPSWLALMEGYGALDSIDVVAIHAFPHMWWPDAPCWDWPDYWSGWDAKVGAIAGCAGGRPVWITETGLATCEVHSGSPCRHDLQVEKLLDAAEAPAERVYWYCLTDLHPARDAIEGFHVDENEYHMGLVTWTGEPKPAYHTMKRLLAGTDGPDAHRAPSAARSSSPHALQKRSRPSGSGSQR
jgi:CDP-paratose 2-epimerase